MQNQIEAEMLETIEKSREEWSHDVTDHTENEYIREGLLNAGYRKQREGEWVKVMNHKECSKCGYNAPYKKIKAGYHLQDLSNYCPNCGAKMKGGE